jgi:hypothetical protein
MTSLLPFGTHKLLLVLIVSILPLLGQAQTSTLRCIGMGSHNLRGVPYRTDSLKLEWQGNFGGDYFEDYLNLDKLTYNEFIRYDSTSILLGSINSYFFNANDQIVSYINRHWDHSAYQNFSRRTDSLDAQGRVVKRFHEAWVSGTWQNSRFELDSFDAANNVIQTNRWNWISSTGSWLWRDNIVSTFNSAGKLTMRKRIYYNNSAWTNQDKSEKVYDANNNLLAEVSYTGRDSIWKNSQFWLHQYDVNNNEMIYTYYNWDSGTSSWKNVWRDLFNYDGNNLKTDWTHQTFSTIWDNAYKYSYTYNGANLTETSTRENWMSGAWVNASKTLTQYNGNGFIVENLIQNWDGSTFADANRATTLRNNFDQRMSITYEAYSSGSWNTTQKTFYYYESYTPNGIGEFSEPLEASVYPNPFTLNTMVDFAQAASGTAAFRIYNINGELVKEEKAYYPAGKHHWFWDGTNATGALVSSGVYFIKAEAGNKLCIMKLIKL